MKSRKKAAQDNTREVTQDITPKKRKKKHKKAPVIIAAILVIFVVFRIIGSLGAGQAGTLVTTVSAVRGDLQESVNTSGTVLSEEVRVIFAPVSGTLAEVNVSAGDVVNAGTQLVTYDMEKMEKTLHQSALQLEKSMAGYDNVLSQSAQKQAELREANTNLSVLNRQIEDNKAYLKDLQEKLTSSQRDTSNALAAESFELQEKLKNLTPGTEEYDNIASAISRNGYLQQIASASDYVAEMQKEIQEVQERIAGYEEYKTRMESQKSASEAAVLTSFDKVQYDADNELANLSYQETEDEYAIAQKGIVAEFDGIITECSAVPGSGVSSGMQLLTLESSENLKVVFNASKYDIEKLALGQKAEVVISGGVYQGEISKINRMAVRNESNTPMVGVEIHLLDPDDNIILGMDAKLTIYTQKAENVLLVPVEAINADKEGDFLYVVENGVAVRRAITCGISTDTYTEVKEGLGEEDVIILNAYSDLSEGTAVIVMPQQ